MVLFFDGNNERSNFVRSELLGRLIPCAVSLNADITRCSFVNIVLMNDEESLHNLNVDRETILFADGKALADVSRRDAEITRLISRIEDILFIKYRLDVHTFVRGAVYDSPDESRYYGKTCFFTHTEKLMLRFIGSVGDKGVTSDLICAFCLEREAATSAVAVHVSKINKAASACSLVKPISSKRKQGYRLTLL